MTDKDNKAHKTFCRICYIAALVAFSCNLVGCGVQKPIVEYRDSIRVEIRERIVRDTVSFAIVGDFKEKTSKDTTSLLKNDYAQSYASVEGGLLHHSLQTFPKTIKVPYQVMVRDTVIVERQAETIVQEVPRQPSKWESFAEVCGYILMGLVGIGLLLLALKILLKRI